MYTIYYVINVQKVTPYYKKNTISSIKLLIFIKKTYNFTYTIVYILLYITKV